MKNRTLSLGLILVAMLFATVNLTSCGLRNERINETEETGNEEEKEEENEEEEENGADKQLSSWFQSKGYPDASNLTQKYAAAWEEFQELKKRSPFQQYASRLQGMGNWTHVGPKAFGGRFLCIAINPQTNASGNYTIFAGSAGGGIWKTYVSGVGASAWQPVETNTAVLGVSSLAYHPTDTSILLAGTGESYRIESYSSSPYSSNQVSNIGRNAWKARGTYGVGILRSADAGQTWTQTLIKSQSDLFGIQKIKYHPTINNTVFACATDGLYKSTDAGVNWTKIWTGTYCSDILINPSNVNQIVIAAGNVTNNPKGIWRSTDGGTTFTQITAGGFPTPAQYKGFTNFTLLGTAIIASVGVGDNNNDGTYNENEVYRSNDFGANWAAVTNSNHAKWQSWFAHGVTAFPGSTTKVFMYGVKKFTLTMSGGSGTTGASASVATGTASSSYLTDGSQEGSSTYVHDDVHDVQFAPGSSTIAYWATDGGIFRTANAGNAAGSITFVSCNGGLYAQQFYPTIAQSQSTANLALGGLQDNGVIRYNGTGWARVIGGDGTTVSFKPNDETIVLGSNDTRGVNRSTNSGTSFPTSVMSYLGNIPGGYDDRTAFCSPVVVSPSNNNRWYVGSDNIHVSNDAGATFSGNGTPPGTSYIEALHKPAIAIGVSYSNPDKIYVALSPFAQNLLTDGLYYSPPATIRRSTNAGTSFATVSSSLPDRVVTDFAVSPTNDDSVFVTLSGFGTTHIYVTGNGGSTWDPRGSGLPDVPFNTILIDPSNPQILYAGCDFGVYVSHDRGANWYDFNNNFWDATLVMDLAITPGNKIRAATHGKGIFETTRWDGLVTLPVHFLSFAGTNAGLTNNLKWVVDQESNLSRYEVQRSTDGFNYSMVKQVNARNSAIQTTYTIADPVGQNPSPIYYYRLRSVDHDGSYTYSEVVAIKMNEGQKFEVLGNPFAQSLNIRYTTNRTGKLSIALTDLQGRVVRKEEFVAGTGTGTYSVSNLSGLTSGMYVVRFNFEGKNTSVKVIKQ